MAGELPNYQRYGRRRPTRRDPVAPTDNEAGVLAQRIAGVNVLAAGTRQHRSQFCQGNCAQQCVDSADDPDGEEQPWALQMGGDVAWRPEYACADRVPDDDCEPKADAEYAQ